MKAYRTLILIILVFATPVIMAKLILEWQWYQGGVTNHGLLLSTPSIQPWLPSTGKWQLIYRLPEACELRCEAALFTLRQLPSATGADQDRIGSLVLMTEEQYAMLAPTIDEQLLGIDVFLIPKEIQPDVQAWEFGEHAIYLSDPLRTVMLAYPVVSTKTEVLAQGKGMLKDLKRLLKVSKVG